MITKPSHEPRLERLPPRLLPSPPAYLMQDSPPRTSHGEYTCVSPPKIHRIGDKHPPLTPLDLLSSFSSGLGSVGSWTSGRLRGFFSPSFSSYSRSTDAPPSYDSLYNRPASTKSQPYDPSVDPIYTYPYPPAYPDHGNSFLEAATTECHTSNPLKHIYFSAPASAFPHPIDSMTNTATTTTTPHSARLTTSKTPGTPPTPPTSATPPSTPTHP